MCLKLCGPLLISFLLLLCVVVMEIEKMTKTKTKTSLLNAAFGGDSAAHREDWEVRNKSVEMEERWVGVAEGILRGTEGRTVFGVANENTSMAGDEAVVLCAQRSMEWMIEHVLHVCIRVFAPEGSVACVGLDFVVVMDGIVDAGSLVDTVVGDTLGAVENFARSCCSYCNILV